MKSNRKMTTLAGDNPFVRLKLQGSIASEGGSALVDLFSAYGYVFRIFRNYCAQGLSNEVPVKSYGRDREVIGNHREALYP